MVSITIVYDIIMMIIIIITIDITIMIMFTTCALLRLTQ